MAEDSFSRFWSKVDRSGGPNSCWPWTAYRHQDGYGRFGLNGKAVNAHRVVYTITFGEIPYGLQVLHRCDNPPCCNPAHLFLGNHDINMADKAAKGRVKPNKGSENPYAKLTEPEVIEILQEGRSGFSQHDIAERHNICVASVSHILTGRSWKHVPR